MIMKIIVPFFFLLFFSACVSVSHLKTHDSSQTFPPTAPSSIKLFSTADADNRDYIVIGEIIASADASSAEKPIKYLKKEASKMGADAIINLRLEFEYGGWSTAIKSTGTAVKFK